MTEQSSSKSFFGIYLRYRINQQRVNLIMCVILNILALPLLALALNKGLNNGFDDFYQTGRILAVISAVVLIILAINGAVTSFEFYNKKNLTDTFGVLPITNTQRFFGDLIGGYIANVAPVIPCGLVGGIMFGSMQGKFDAILAENEIEPFMNLRSVGLNLFVALFFIYTITYLIAVLVTSACGRTLHSTVFSIFTAIAIPLFVGGMVGCFAVCMLGVNTRKLMWDTIMLFSPIALMKDVFGAVILFENIDLENPSIVFNAFNPANIIVWTVLAVVLIAAAYFVGKRRKTENVGSSVVVRFVYYVICGLTSGGVCAIILGLIFSDVSRHSPLGHIIPILSGLVISVIMLLLWLPKKRYLLRGIIAGAGSVVAVYGLFTLFDKTGCFGARYFPENSAKIEYVKADDFLTITDKADIEKYMKLNNETLRKNYANIIYAYYSDGYKVEYKLSNGKTIERIYNEGYDYFNSSFFNVEWAMRENEMTLKGYNDNFFDAVSNNSDYWNCYVFNVDRQVNIPHDKNDEFISILRDEVEEKYDPNDVNYYGYAEFRTVRYRRKFLLPNSYTKTIAFLESLGGNYVVETDPNSELFSIGYSPKPNTFDLHLRVKYKDRNDPRVKELQSFFQDWNSTGDDIADEAFSVFMDRGSYRILKENSQRALEIMLELAGE